MTFGFRMSVPGHVEVFAVVVKLASKTVTLGAHLAKLGLSIALSLERNTKSAHGHRGRGCRSEHPAGKGVTKL